MRFRYPGPSVGSEGVFYTQKVLLLFGVYWLARQALLHDEASVRRTMATITSALTVVVSVLLTIQVGMAVSEYGLDNQHLYDYVFRRISATKVWRLIFYSFY